MANNNGAILGSFRPVEQLPEVNCLPQKIFSMKRIYIVWTQEQTFSGVSYPKKNLSLPPSPATQSRAERNFSQKNQTHLLNTQ